MRIFDVEIVPTQGQSLRIYAAKNREPGPNVARILAEEGISIAGGQGRLKGKVVRIAHMGYISKADLDAGFAALARRLPSAKT